MKPNTKWTPDRVAAIRDLAASGCSGSQIAAHYRVSRNAIIGVCFRNNIPLGGSNPCPKRRGACANAVATLRVAEKRKMARARTAAPVPPPEAKPAPRAIPEQTEGIPLEALTKHTCRWPLLDTLPQLFCGHHTDDGRYCQHHAAKAVSANQGGRL